MKKRTYHIEILLGFMILMHSCVLERIDDYYDRTNAGKQTFDQVENNLGAFLHFFDIALKMNAYLKVPEEKRQEAEDHYFPRYKIRQVEKNTWVGLNNSDTIFKVICTPLALVEKGAEWIVYCAKREYDGKVTVKCTEAGEWELKGEEVKFHYWASDANLKIKNEKQQFPDEYSTNEWTISGSGKSITEISNKIMLSYDIVQPLHKISENKFPFNEGVLHMKAIDFSLQEEEIIKAEIKKLPARGRKVEIEYKGKAYIYINDENISSF